MTLGDVTIYSTYLYVHHRVAEAGYPVEIVNGIPSFCAVAARLNMGLVENQKCCTSFLHRIRSRKH